MVFPLVVANESALVEPNMKRANDHEINFDYAKDLTKSAVFVNDVLE